jgi:hypothetical protein
MAHINSIGAGMYSRLDIAFGVVASGKPGTISLPATPDAITNWQTLFANSATFPSGGIAGSFCQVKDVREFPAMGVPPNIVNVPVFGQPTSQQVQGQADAPSMELTVNYVATDFAKDTTDTTVTLGELVGCGITMAFRFTLLNTDPGSVKVCSTGTDKFVENNSSYYWIGKIEALVVNPQLTDANTATLTISLQSKLYGAFTTI